MDELLNCAKAFEDLLPVIYHIIDLFDKNDLIFRYNRKLQAVYTLLKKEKINTATGTVQIQYDRLSPKNKE